MLIYLISWNRSSILVSSVSCIPVAAKSSQSTVRNSQFSRQITVAVLLRAETITACSYSRTEAEQMSIIRVYGMVELSECQNASSGNNDFAFAWNIATRLRYLAF